MSELEATLPSASDVPPRPAKPTLADQVAAIDAVEVAARIVATQGTRAAIAASATEIIALAQMTMRLTVLADLTFQMLGTADALQAARDLDARRALKLKVTQELSGVGFALEALGYGAVQPTTITTEENTNGQS
jgi:glucosamine 6-phosphate synthetase-like amidotransferase/phosphosugar isomerase protein